MNITEKMRFFKGNRVVSWHEHVYPDARLKLDRPALDMMIRDMDIAGFDVCVVSRPYATKHRVIEVMEAFNDAVAEAIRLYPERIEGFAFVDPIHGRNAVYEIHRCVEELGFTGIKLYDHFHICDEHLDIIIESAIKLDVPILDHAGKACKKPLVKPLESDSTHFIKAAVKYPEAVFIIGHIGGGGDWEWQLKGISRYPNIFVDISGSVHDDLMIEETLKAIGAKRMLFATDGSFSSGIGKLLDANISIEDKLIIMNNPVFERYLRREKKS